MNAIDTATTIAASEFATATATAASEFLADQWVASARPLTPAKRRVVAAESRPRVESWPTAPTAVAERGLPFMAIRGVLARQWAGLDVPVNGPQNADSDLTRALRGSVVGLSDVARFGGFVRGLIEAAPRLWNRGLCPAPMRGWNSPINEVGRLASLWLRWKTPGALARAYRRAVRRSDLILAPWGVRTSWRALIVALDEGPLDPRKAGFVAAALTLHQRGGGWDTDRALTYRAAKEALVSYRGFSARGEAEVRRVQEGMRADGMGCRWPVRVADGVSFVPDFSEEIGGIVVVPAAWKGDYSAYFGWASVDPDRLELGVVKDARPQADIFDVAASAKEVLDGREERAARMAAASR